VTLPEQATFGSLFQIALRNTLSTSTVTKPSQWLVFMEDSGQIITLTASPPKSPVFITISGQTMSTNLVDVRYEGLNIEGQLFMEGPDYELVRQTTNFSGMELIMTRTSKEEALKMDRVQEHAPDVLLSFRVPVNRPLQVQKARSEVRLQLRSKVGVTFKFPSDSRQRFDDQSSLLVLKTMREGKWTVKRPVPGPEFEPYLQPTVYEQSQDPAVRETAQRVVKGEPVAWKAVKKLTEWVHRHIRDKNYAVGFASAKEVLNQAKGDCTEHAVLLGALCKAAGIPTRTVVGLVGQGEWFLYHMWVECYVGEWVPVDAAFNQAPVDIWHIKYRDGLLDESGFFSMGVAMLPLLNNIELKFLGSK